MPPAVLHVLTSTDRRGAETFGVYLDEHLRRRSWPSDVVALSAGSGGLAVRTLGPRRWDLRTLLALRRAARGRQVVVAHGSDTLGASALALLATGVPFVYANIGDPRFWAGSGLRHRRVRWFLGRAAHVVAISPTSERVLVERFRVPPERVNVVPNGRPVERYRPLPAAVREEVRRDAGLPTTPVVVVVGALTAGKRVDDAVRAVARLDGVHLLVVGEGEQDSELRALAAAMLPGRATFTGRVPDPSRLIAASDVLLSPSETEGVPGVVIEAGLCGVPAVATDVGFTSDVVQHGTTGFLVRPNDCADMAAHLARAIADPALGEASRKHCEAAHDLDVVAEQWAATLLRVSRQGPRSGPARRLLRRARRRSP